MGDATRPTLLPPSSGSFTPATPSGLTPNTRSEAEAALTLNSSTQTDSAAPTTPLPSSIFAQGNMYPMMGAAGGNTQEGQVDDGSSEAQKAYRRPGGPVRTSSTNYERALQEFRKQSSASSNMNNTSMDGTAEPASLTEGGPVASPTSATLPFPPPGQGVVPLHSGVGSGQADAVKKARPSGLSLGQLGRQQSWSEQDFKHIYSAGLMGEVKGDAGYDSAADRKA